MKRLLFILIGAGAVTAVIYFSRPKSNGNHETVQSTNPQGVSEASNATQTNLHLEGFPASTNVEETSQSNMVAATTEPSASNEAYSSTPTKAGKTKKSKKGKNKKKSKSTE